MSIPVANCLEILEGFRATVASGSPTAIWGGSIYPGEDRVFVPQVGVLFPPNKEMFRFLQHLFKHVPGSFLWALTPEVSAHCDNWSIDILLLS